LQHFFGIIINLWHRFPAAFATACGVVLWIAKFVFPTPTEVAQTWIRGFLQRKALAYWKQKIWPQVVGLWVALGVTLLLVWILSSIKKSQSGNAAGVFLVLMLILLTCYTWSKDKDGMLSKLFQGAIANNK
jgi:hypothetical protein